MIPFFTSIITKADQKQHLSQIGPSLVTKSIGSTEVRQERQGIHYNLPYEAGWKTQQTSSQRDPGHFALAVTPLPL